ncbi:MAG: aspartate-semialdehyde dehydrogenase [Gemmatimonadales bacterium]
MSRIPVAVLGATGTVGQKLVRLLDQHPWFEVAFVTASGANAGKPYGEAVRWREPVPIPERAAGLVLGDSGRPAGVPLAFSALDTQAAVELEPLWAAAGAMIVTNASPLRMAPDVPLVVPEINARHLGLLDRQRKERGWRGGVVANPNCTTTGLVLALAPLEAAFGIDRLFVSTMQAISGAGWPGVASLDILGNVIPFIGGEEEKVERETRKILGRLDGRDIVEAPVVVSAHTNRVPVIDGHTETVSIGFRRPASPEEVAAALESWRPEPPIAALPSTPERPVLVETRPDRPQPRLDLERGGGMSAVVGRIRPCPLLHVRFVVLSHNTVRGAAGATIQNAELLVSAGVVAR